MTDRGPALFARVRRAARETPARRDRYVDFLRAMAILTVVLGHWLAVVIVSANGMTGDNALAHLPWARPLTWFLQVMPVFFLVGGYANAASMDLHRRRGGDGAGWLLGRTDRLLRPTSAFLGLLWACALVAGLAGTARNTMKRPRLRVGESFSGRVVAEGRTLVAEIAALDDLVPEHRAADEALGTDRAGRSGSTVPTCAPLRAAVPRSRNLLLVGTGDRREDGIRLPRTTVSHTNLFRITLRLKPATSIEMRILSRSVASTAGGRSWAAPCARACSRSPPR